MSRDRFLQLFWNLHLRSPSSSPDSPRSAKVQPLLDLLCPRFESVLKLGEFIAVDKAIVAFEGRAFFRQYIRGKPHPYGIKVYVLSDSKTGYVYRLRIYFGKQTELIQIPSLSHSTRVVLTLVEPLHRLGYHVITDRFYSSPELAMELEQRGLAFTGTVQVNRRGMPLAVKSTLDRQMQRGEVKAYRAGKPLVVQWKDKRIITVLTTSGSCNVIDVQTHRGEHKKKPAIVQLYNNNMLGVDKMDQLASYYAFVRKSVKWWRKVFFWLLEVSVVNSYISYKTRLQQLGQEPITHLQYRRSLILSLVSHQLNVPQQPRPGGRADMSLERLRPIPHFAEEAERLQGGRRDLRNDCRVCSRVGHRRTTNFCTTCTDKPFLHPGRCFRLYHTRARFRGQN